MTKLRVSLMKTLEVSKKVPDMVLIGGNASIAGIEDALYFSVSKLDLMLKDCTSRLKMYEELTTKKKK